ncbi:alpha/beta fold hydrolase [Paenibacillus sp. RC67]|uniref:alpha/beta fold hydrolase n=1 Tax=Paenibacillus sp. RC67 TaxID=3039392 RepID=UPI0024ADF4FA|nr:alpha/beta fold hydrolase [Paenibacillus sp. RC67]
MIQGELMERTLKTDPLLSYYLYVPKGIESGAPIFITVHGISRNAAEHANRLAPFAEQYGVVLVAPMYDKSRFPDYNCLGREGQGERSDRALDRILEEVGALTEAATDKVYLFGYSGGGQFAHRYALAYPERVECLVVGAAGWYTFPDHSFEYPQGIGSFPGLEDVEMDPDRFLNIPTCVLVGEADTERGTSLNQDAAVDAQQGLNRVERGLSWLTAIRAAAHQRGLDTRYHYETLPQSTHSFARCMTKGGLGHRVFEFMFGKNFYEITK